MQPPRVAESGMAGGQTTGYLLAGGSPRRRSAAANMPGRGGPGEFTTLWLKTAKLLGAAIQQCRIALE